MGEIFNSLISIFNNTPKGELKCLTDCVNNSFMELWNDQSLLNLEYNITTSTGEWLEEWGKWFGVPRSAEELNESYRTRILLVLTKPRITAPALKSIVESYVDDPGNISQIYEPFNNIFTFNKSAFSGKDKLQSGSYYRSGVVDIISPESNKSMMQEIQRSKGAGIKAYYQANSILGGDGNYGEVSFGEWVLTQFYSLHCDMPIKDKLETCVFSGAYSGRGLRSGRQVTFDTQEIQQVFGASMLLDIAPRSYDREFTGGLLGEPQIDVSINGGELGDDLPIGEVLYGGELNNSLDLVMHNLDFEVPSYEVRIKHKGICTRSSYSGMRSGRYSLSGTYTGEIDGNTKIMEIFPTSNLYTVSVVKDKKIRDIVEDYSGGVEVYIHRISGDSLYGGELGDALPITGSISGGELGLYEYVQQVIEG